MRASTMLLVVLWVKIAATLILWAAPLLLLPAARIRRIGIPVPEPMLFIRLLGAAYTALLVGYLLGSFNLSRNQDITEIVWIGIVSNGLAWVVLTYFGVIGTWRVWSGRARLYMWLSAMMTGSIMIGLLASGLLAGGAKPG